MTLNKKEISKVRFRERKLSEKEKQEMWKNIQKVTLNRERKIHLYKWIPAAAVILVFLSIGTYFIYNHINRNHPIDYAKILKEIDINPSSDSIQVLLGNEEKLLLGEKEASLKYNKEGQLEVNNQNIKEEKNLQGEEISFNTLIVPSGKRSYVHLSDGSSMWVNANSKVLYPTKFTKTKREIYVDGEVYLDVVRDENCPFIVKTDRIEVKVLGTSFDVNAHSKMKQVSVVLVSGKVDVRAKKHKSILLPNERLVYNGEQMQKQIVDVQRYVAWRTGKYLIEKIPLSEVLDYLSEYYGLDIEYPITLQERNCSGTLNLTDSFEQILKTLEGANLDLKFFINNNNKINVIVKP